MNEIFEILKYTLPSLIVFITAYLVLRKSTQSEEKRRKVELMLNNQKLITPIRLQAYERMVLLLERIAPQSLVMRTQKPNMTAQELQAKLLKNIRQEYEHNLAHQIYISDKSWEYVKSAKENLVKIINQVSLGIKPEVPAIHLSKRLLEQFIDRDKDPSKKAILYLKNEIKTLF